MCSNGTVLTNVRDDDRKEWVVRINDVEIYAFKSEYTANNLFLTLRKALETKPRQRMRII